MKAQDKLREVFKDVQRIDLDKVSPEEFDARVKKALGVMTTREIAELMKSIAEYEEASPEDKIKIFEGIAAPKPPSIFTRAKGFFASKTR